MITRRDIELVLGWVRKDIRGQELVELVAKELRITQDECRAAFREHFPANLEPDPPEPAARLAKPKAKPVLEVVASEMKASPFASVADLKAKVCRHYGITLAEMDGPCRAKRLAGPRQIAMALAVRHFQPRGYSLSQIGRIFRRDHTTVLYAAKRFGYETFGAHTERMERYLAPRRHMAAGDKPQAMEPVTQVMPDPAAAERQQRDIERAAHRLRLREIGFLPPLGSVSRPTARELRA